MLSQIYFFEECCLHLRSGTQGDQIGRIFAFKVIVNFGQFLNITNEALILSI
jgi:hypothetical protein